MGFPVHEEDGGWWKVAFESPGPFVSVCNRILAWFLSGGIGSRSYSAAAERNDSRLAGCVLPNRVAQLFGQSREVRKEREPEETGDKI